ncbi:hypothetical protein RFI_19542, partial [Reticulomyxa filosa]
MKILEVKENIRLEASLRQICCPFAPKRINGMTEIMQYIELVLEKDKWQKGLKVILFYFIFLKKTLQRLPSPDREAVYNNTFADPKWLQQWIEQNKVLEKILDRTTVHLELVRRVLPIYYLFRYNNQLTKEHLKLLWALTTGGTHEFLFREIEKTPSNEIDSQLLDLIKAYSLTAYAMQEKETSNSDKPHWFGLQMLWKFLQSCDS